MHSTQRQKLRWTKSTEPVNAVGVVLKCSVCLAALILAAVIGSADEKVAGGTQAMRAAAPGSMAVANPTTAVAHRKEIFDGRRAHFLGSAAQRELANRDLSKRADVVGP